VIVTHNRRDLLAECLEAVVGQTRAPDVVLVLDNASSDGTAEMVEERFPGVGLIRRDTNTGGAAGYHDVLRRAVEDDRHFDWVWSLDDDTIPRPDALERLLDVGEDPGTQPPPMLLASKVVWTDGAMHPMNHPIPRVRELERFVEGASRGLVEVRAATWISLLIRREAIERYGLPHLHYFIWSDDIEWTARVLRHERGYLVPGSVALHKTATAHTAPQGGERFYYAIRNGLFVIRARGVLTPKEKFLHLVLVGEQVRQYLVTERFRPRALAVVARGALHGLVHRAE
jgi:GT2 family glycosyltransferase